VSQPRKLLVTGASGLLGVNLGFQAAGRYRVSGVTNSHVLRGAPFEGIAGDLAENGLFARILEQVRPDAVIHAAALANVDICEKDPGLSSRLNAELPGEVAHACARLSLPLIHISTDAVFDGLRGDYSEEDAPNPQGVYARDKLAGELAVAAAYPQAMIARVNFFGWSLSGRRSLAEFFFNNLSAGNQVNGFTDVLFCPLQANLLAETLFEMLDLHLGGLFHVLSREHQSKYQFGLNIARAFGLNESLIHPVSVEAGGLVARRSPNLTLRVGKLEAALGHAMPGQAEGVQLLLRQHQEGYDLKVKSLGI
jgi:dTDP-4-dehydrorhamnose reductase